MDNELERALDNAATSYKRDGDHVLGFAFTFQFGNGLMKQLNQMIVDTKHPAGFEAGTDEHRFRTIVKERANRS